MKLSILIVSWNTRELLEQCLASVYAHPPKAEFEILVVDNGSVDGSPEMVSERFPRTRLIESETNLGFARGNNAAYRQSDGEYILLLNPDTVVKTGALDTLVSFLDQHPNAGAAGPRLLNPDGSLQLSCSPAPTVRREFARLFHLPGVRPDGYYPMQDWDLHDPIEVEVIKGACLLLRREALGGPSDLFGLFDEEYFMYTEEVDLCYRLGRNGWKLYWVPKSQVVHYGGQSTRQAATEMFLNLYTSKIQFFRKHYSSAAVQAYKLVLLLATVGRLFATPLALLESGEKRSKHLDLSEKYGRLLLALPRM